MKMPGTFVSIGLKESEAMNPWLFKGTPAIVPDAMPITAVYAVWSIYDVPPAEEGGTPTVDYGEQVGELYASQASAQVAADKLTEVARVYHTLKKLDYDPPKYGVKTIPVVP